MWGFVNYLPYDPARVQYPNGRNAGTDYSRD